MNQSQDRRVFLFTLFSLMICCICVITWGILPYIGVFQSNQSQTPQATETRYAQMTQTAVETQISGLVSNFTTQTVAAKTQTPTATPSPIPSINITPNASRNPPSAIDWYQIPVIGHILVNLKALAGGGNELIVALLTAIIMLLVTQFRRLTGAIASGFRFFLSLIRGHNKDIRFEHEYFEWLISQHRHLGLLPAQVVARRWGERQQFVELEKIYVRLSLSTQAGDEQWANFSTDSAYRWRRIPSRLLNAIRSFMRFIFYGKTGGEWLFLLTFFLGTLLGALVGALIDALAETSSGAFWGAVIGFIVGTLIGSLLQKLREPIGKKIEDAWFLSDAIYESGSLGLVIDRYPRLIIRGDPGSGKSTLLRFIAITCARALRKDRKDGDLPTLVRSRLKWDHPPFPILVRLNRNTKVVDWGNERGLIDTFRDELPIDLRRLCPDGFFERQLKTRPCLILLDAFDELGNPATRAVMAQYIQGFLDVYGQSIHRMVVTTRIVGYEGQLDRFGFHIRTVQPLQDGEIRSLIKQRYKAFAFIEISERSLSAARAIEQRLMERAENLIEKVEQLSTLRQLAINPMLLSLITLVSFLKVELPDERVLLYRDCVEILTERWAEYKLSESGARIETKSGLSLNQKIILLRDLAFAMQQRRERDASQALISQKDACSLIASRLSEFSTASLSQDKSTQSLEAYRLAEGWLESVQVESGILVAQGLNLDGENLIGFSHLTFQEYLAAIAVREVPFHWEILRRNILNPAWHEVVLLYSVLVEDATSVIQTLLDASEQPAGLVLAGRCLSERVRKVDQDVQRNTLNGLKKVFFSNNVDILREVSEIFSTIGGSDLTNILINAIQDDYTPRQLAAIRSLNNIREDNPMLDEVRQKLARILDTECSLDVKIAASETLAHIGDPRFISLEPVMIPVMKSDFVNRNNRGRSFSKRFDDYIFLVSRSLVKYRFGGTHDYEIARFPVTNLEYGRFIDETNSPAPRNWIEGIYPKHKASHPVQDVYLDSALHYCDWLSRKTGITYRLPTEWEWELAASGPNQSEYPWGNEFDANKCNTLESNKEDTTPVGTFFDTKSQAGLQDTCGNVEEITIGLSPSFGWASISRFLGPMWKIFFMVGVIAILGFALLAIVFGNVWYKGVGIGLWIGSIAFCGFVPTLIFWLYFLSSGRLCVKLIDGYWKGGSWNKPHIWSRLNYRNRKGALSGSGFRVARSLHRDYLRKVEPYLAKLLGFPSSRGGILLGLLVIVWIGFVILNSIGIRENHYVSKGNLYASQGDITQAWVYYNKAISINPERADTWNSICWNGSLYGYAVEVMDTCKKAVSLEPENSNIRDSRGLARALTGDYQGAIEDFRYFAEKSSQTKNYIKLRILWIAQLQVGNSPFDSNTLNLILQLNKWFPDPKVWDELLDSREIQ